MPPARSHKGAGAGDPPGSPRAAARTRPCLTQGTPVSGASEDAGLSFRVVTASPPCNSSPGPPFLDNERTRHLNGADLGAVAQLGERCNRTAEVRSSILLGSTK